jgi:hypothetical protein
MKKEAPSKIVNIAGIIGNAVFVFEDTAGKRTMPAKGFYPVL